MRLVDPPEIVQMAPKAPLLFARLFVVETVCACPEMLVD